jgi:beta-barrel assembly-enhancing protease
MKILRSLWIVAIVITIVSCKKDDEDKPFVLLPVQNDIDLGLQVSEEIAANPTEYPVLDEVEYAEAYAYLQGITDEILNSGKLAFRNRFAWKIHIIHDDEVLNAFATPGGYIYVYTGLIKYLEQEDDLAGVMGHEIAHADRRHSMQQMQKLYGANLILSILVGSNPSQLGEIVAGLAGNATALAFSRDNEADADEYSVIYLAETKYACNGAYSFFQKLIESGQAGNTPKFLSTHPDPASRVEDINAKATELGCDTTPLAPASYEDFKNSLPE